MHYDLLIKNGAVVDPVSRSIDHLDLAIRDGVIADIGPAIPLETAQTVIDARERYVTPGLIDLHTHAYWGASFWGVEPDPIAARSGVTTWVDAGTAGAYNFHGLRRYAVEASRSRVLAFFNLSMIGLAGPSFELANLDYCDVPLAASVIEANRDIIVGVKARISRDTSRGTGIEPLRLARQLADQVDLPLMVHIAAGPPTLREICAYLRPGDILTHCFTGRDNRVIDENGRIHSFVRELLEAGLILDVAHGTGGFSFEVAEAMLDQGLPPDVISTDIHQMSIQGPMYDLPTTLSKFMALGMSLLDVIERATTRSARAINRPHLGTLRKGATADVAIFQLQPGAHTFHDIYMVPRQGNLRLVNELTILDGVIMERCKETALEPWAVRPAHQVAGTTLG